MGPVAFDEVLGDLVAEYDRIESILLSLSEVQWASESAAPGWSVRETVVHLATTEEGVADTLRRPGGEWTVRDRPLDRVVGEQVARDRSPAAAVFSRWQSARRASIDALRSADRTATYRWAAAPLRPQTLATTRLAEHWAHLLDVTGPLGIAYPDTDRLRHIAWLGHATIPYALRLQGHDDVEIRAELTAPSGVPWTFGPADAPDRISGEAGAFCRVGAQRLAPWDSGLSTSSPSAALALSVLRNYAA
jgi:uncharacterized protein (TIGR03084 family)